MDRNILSTSPLHQSLIDKLGEHGISVDISSMINIEPVKSDSVTKQLKELFTQQATVVFTSVNAVEHVIAATAKGAKLDWRIFCTSKATADAVKDFFGADKIVAMADNASKLAEKIIKNKCKNVVFFCGNKARYELPDKLIKAKIAVQKIVVYNTVVTSAKMTKFYNAILFFSPSGVDSFLTENEFPTRTVLFAIGDTTADALKEVTRNRIIISSVPSKENMVELVVDFFEQSESR